VNYRKGELPKNSTDTFEIAGIRGITMTKNNDAMNTRRLFTLYIMRYIRVTTDERPTKCSQKNGLVSTYP
jgi:hypothetical protein